MDILFWDCILLSDELYILYFCIKYILVCGGRLFVEVVFVMKVYGVYFLSK